MINEIGSEFCDVPTIEGTESIFPGNTVWYLSGRCALRAIIKDIKKSINFKKVALPSWCCDSMIIPFLDEKVDVSFYSVYFQGGTIQRDFSNIYGCDAVLLTDYFGFKRSCEFDFNGIVINDVTHSVFCGDFENSNYIFGSLRKWAGFYTGGFAISANGMLQIHNVITDSKFIAMRKNAMEEKRDYLNGKLKEKIYLEKFSQAEELLEEYSCGSADYNDILRAKNLDIKYIKEKRRDNASVIMDALSKFTIFEKLEEKDCPLFVPLLIPNGKRDELRNYLIENNIYCPIHWPLSKYHKLHESNVTIYEQEISIICDQRYSMVDMEYICAKITDFLGCDK